MTHNSHNIWRFKYRLTILTLTFDITKQANCKFHFTVDPAWQARALLLTKNSSKKYKITKKMANDMEKKIVRQVEYYFGDINLPRDKFLQGQIKENEDGWVPLDVMLKFKRLAELSKDPAVIAEALAQSDDRIVVVSEDKTKIRRNPEKPLPDNNDEHIKVLREKTGKTHVLF